MAVIYYQLTIFLSITFAFHFGRANPKLKHLGLGITFFWCIWTLLNVFISPLFLIQFGVILGTFRLNQLWSKNLLSRKKLSIQAENLEIQYSDLANKNEELTAQIAEVVDLYNESLRENLSTLDQEAFHPVVNSEHKEYLYRAFKEAEESVCITSGWINDRVVNKELAQYINSALERNVKVFILFGYQSKGKEPDLKSDAKKALERFGGLARLAKHKRRGELSLSIQGTHEKLLVVDDKYLIIGSHNWLSNSSYINSERSYLIKDTEIATKERTRIKKKVQSNQYPLTAA